MTLAQRELLAAAEHLIGTWETTTSARLYEKAFKRLRKAVKGVVLEEAHTEGLPVIHVASLAHGEEA